MAKFKVGDKVELVSKRPCGWNIEGAMDCFLNSIQTIKSICGENVEFEKEETDSWYFNIDCISRKAFEVGEMVTLNIENKEGLLGFYSGDICEILENNVSGKKPYKIRKYKDIIGYAFPSELTSIPEFLEPKLEITAWSDKIMRYTTEDLIENMKKTNPALYPGVCLGFDFNEDKGENKMEILKIYERKARNVIEKKYDELEKEVKENDAVKKIIQDASNQINVLLDRDEKNAIDLTPPLIYSELLEPKSSEKIVELKRERGREERNVEKLIEEVKARLEICDNTEESKIAVLKTYGILNSDGKIAEYKIEKKGKK